MSTMNLLKRITGFDLSSRKQRFKLFLLIFAAAIVGVSLYYTDTIIKKITEDERVKVKLWADAVQQRAGLVQYTEQFFEFIKEEERKRVELQAQVYRRLIYAVNSGELNFLFEVLRSNTTIPVVLTDESGEILSSMNLEGRFANVDTLNDEMMNYFSAYEPIRFAVDRQTTQYIYYRDSKLFTELRDVLDDLVKSFISDIVISSANIPVIVTDSAMTRLIDHGNMGEIDPSDSLQVQSVIESMADKNPPITIYLPNFGTCHVYYTNSFLVTQLRYYPLAQLLVVGIFLLVSYILFSIARNAEQNLVWVGMSKETAHQLGTPLSSLLAWVELLRMKGVDEETVNEIVNDLKRLENITERFSKIGSTPNLIPVNVMATLSEAIGYMKTRTSNKVQFVFENNDDIIETPINTNLFGWVVENIIKNAVDAMSGEGVITIKVTNNNKHVIIDISDTGRGIHPSKFNSIFKPGYTSKKRGWGLGLSLSKRIIENYHKGKLFVKESAPNKGTTFRIMLKRSI
jgi:two-component system, sporulation sensor kinase D